MIDEAQGIMTISITVNEARLILEHLGWNVADADMVNHAERTRSLGFFRTRLERFIRIMGDPNGQQKTLNG